jgi:hypothetical protein
MPKPTPALDYNVDRRKYEVGDKLRYRNEKGKVAEHVVYGVRFKEDVDGIRYDYEYIMDVEDFEWVKDDANGNKVYGPALYCIINSSEVVEKL